LIDHITIRVSDVERARKFYEQVFLPLGYKISFGEEKVFWAFDVGKGCLFEIAQYTGQTPLTPVHVAFRVESPAHVQQMYDAAMAAGARDNGPPGPRPQYTKNYFACFVFDQDGHNIEAVFDEISTEAGAERE
jgi:catechol 2,3-dioxygenase-like lactoylglutathione lyase family enzyme